MLFREPFPYRAIAIAGLSVAVWSAGEARACMTNMNTCTDNRAAIPMGEGIFQCPDSTCPTEMTECPPSAATLVCLDGTQPVDYGTGPKCYNQQCVPRQNSTATATATATLPDTGTAVFTASTSSTHVAVSTVAALSTAAETDFSHQAASIAGKNDGQQQASLQDAAELRRLGANRAATIGALFCAEGANTALKDPELSGSDFAACRDQFAAANALKMGGLSADQKVAGTDGALATLANLEKNFGVSPGDYLTRLLGSDGSRDALSDLLGSKLSADKLDAAYAAADAIPPKSGDGKYEVSFGAATAPGKSLALRDTLKKKLADSAALKGEKDEAARDRRPAGERFAGLAPTPESNKLRGLQPLRDGLFGADEQRELTIFDVVHRRYEAIRRSRGF